jgi:hypothetical protein
MTRAAAQRATALQTRVSHLRFCLVSGGALRFESAHRKRWGPNAPER